MTKILAILTKRTTASGQVMIEFALVIPVLVLIFLGTMDLARAVYAYGVISDAARVGAHWGSLRPVLPITADTLDKEHGDIDFDDVKYRIMGGGPKHYPSKIAGLDPSLVHPAPTCQVNPDNPYMDTYDAGLKAMHKCDSWNFMSVVVTYDFHPITMFFSTFSLQAQSTMTIE